MKYRNEHIRILENLLDKIVKNPEYHIKWLNTLSYLEYTGARKIHKANFGKYLNFSILSHAAEESRHAFLYKRNIKKVNPGIDLNEFGYISSNLLAGFSAYKYFQLLDITIRDKISRYYSGYEKNFFCYLFTTLLIEERANMVFAIYQERLEDLNQNFSIQGIIKEEERHLDEIYSLLEKNLNNYYDFLQKFFDKESDLFDKFLKKLEQIVV